MELDSHQKRAGRVFRDSCRERLGKLPSPGLTAPDFVRYVRHECEAARRLSTAIYLAEHYIPSPEYWVCYCSATGTPGRDFPHEDCDGGRLLLAAGALAYIWKEGACRACGVTVRSRGHVAVSEDWPPLHGAVREEF